MKSFLFTTAILITNIQSQEYVPSVPELLSNIFVVAGTSCNIDADCDALYEIPSNMTAFWSCVKETGIVQSDNTTKDISFCQFNECDSISDCNSGEICYKINQCDDDNVFYDLSYTTYSTICQPVSLCNNLKTEGQWTSNSMCYKGEDDGTTYYSQEAVVLCGAAGGTCVASSSVCSETTTTTNTPSDDCKDDKTCCTKDGWDETGCLELLFTEYLIYTVIALAVLLLCCCGCCCCIYKSRKKAETYDEMDNQTNHYNVYI